MCTTQLAPLQVFQHPTTPKGIRRNERSWESLSTAGLSAAGQAKPSVVSEALVYGLPPSILAKALSPKSILCDAPFELTIDDYRFIGRHAHRSFATNLSALAVLNIGVQ